MFRRLIPLVVAMLVASGCSGEADDPSATYFGDAAAISNQYETAAFSHFTDYQTALEAATAETGDAIYVEANQDLFDSLANEFDTAVAGLSGLTPPAGAVDQHDAWLLAAQNLHNAFRSADDELAALTEAPAANTVVSELPLADLQAAYRAACQSVAALATGVPTTSIACQPPSNGA